MKKVENSNLQLLSTIKNKNTFLAAYVKHIANLMTEIKKLKREVENLFQGWNSSEKTFSRDW